MINPRDDQTVTTSDRVIEIIRKYAPMTQEQIRYLLWDRYKRACTQQAVSWHCRKVGALRDADGFWYVP